MELQYIILVYHIAFNMLLAIAKKHIPTPASIVKVYLFFFKKLKEYLPSNKYEDLDKYQRQLIAFMSHHARKTYLKC
jgi:hypothetical protein